jgi:hypothetical protein
VLLVTKLSVKECKRLRVCSAVGVILAAVIFPVLGAVVYDNSVYDLIHRLNPGSMEIGDEITLDDTARVLTNFTFEYWGENSTGDGFDGYVEAKVRFYQNDGALASSDYPTPGTVLFDSGWFPVEATPRATLIFEDFHTDAEVPLTRPVPDSFTWTIQFGGLAPGDSAGVDIFSPPVVGMSYPDYWQLTPDSGWLLLENSMPMNFAARIEAVPLMLAVERHPGGLVISWPGFVRGMTLQSSPSLDPSIAWRDVTSHVTVLSNRCAVTIQDCLSQQFFRLSLIP